MFWLCISLWLWFLLTVTISRMYFLDTGDKKVFSAVFYTAMLGPFILTYLIVKTIVTGRW